MVTGSAEPRWLTADQQKIWRAYLLGSAQLSERLDADLRQFGIDLPEYEILVCLEEAPERRLRMSELAAAVALLPVPAHPHHRPDGEDRSGHPDHLSQ